MSAMKSLFRWPRLVISLGTALAALAYAGTANAATYTVNTQADSTTCTATKCSLRGAVIKADNNGGGTIIVPAGTYKLTIAPSGNPDEPKTGDLDIDHATIIKGAGAASTIIDGNQSDRSFAVQKGASLTISGVTIRNGTAGPTSQPPGQYGGGIYSDGQLKINRVILDENVAEHGGSIYVDGDAASTSVTNSVISHSFAGHGGNAGGLYLAGGTLSLSHDLFDTNGGYDQAGTLFEDSGKAVSIDHTSFINGNGEYGGAIYDASGPLTISHSTFDNNSVASESGGALYLNQATGNVKITGSTFSHNSATHDNKNGGAIDANPGPGVTITISGSAFVGNGAHNGGAIDFEAGKSLNVSQTSFTSNQSNLGGALDLVPGSAATTTISRSVFAGNAAYSGGAIYYNGGKSLSMSKSRVTANQAEYGGGLDVETSAGTFTLDHSTLDRNGAAYESGGGLFFNNTSTTRVFNDTISYNEAGNGGGIDFATTVPATLRNDTITHNQAGTTCCGGGINDPSNASSIVNTIVANNNHGDCNALAASADTGHNLDSDGTCFQSSGHPEATGDRTADPKLGPLQNNGGLAPTELPLSGSPAINNGTNVGCPSDDERGVPRPQPPGGRCDIGAVEVAAASLKLSKHGPHNAKAGHRFTYLITVSNDGPGYSTATMVRDRLPKGETLVSASPSQGSCTHSGRTVSCSLGLLAKGVSARVKLGVSESHAGMVVNKATATNAQGSTASAKRRTLVS